MNQYFDLALEFHVFYIENRESLKMEKMGVMTLPLINILKGKGVA
jgi:hypothetical protein